MTIRSYKEVAEILKAQVAKDVEHLSVKAQGIVEGMDLLIKEYDKQVDEESRLSKEESKS